MLIVVRCSCGPASSRGGAESYMVVIMSEIYTNTHEEE